MRVNIFPHYDGIINDNSQYDNEGKEADQTNGNVHRRHQPNSAEKRNRNSEGHPNRQSKPKKQREDHEHQDQAGLAISIKQI